MALAWVKGQAVYLCKNIKVHAGLIPIDHVEGRDASRGLGSGVACEPCHREPARTIILLSPDVSSEVGLKILVCSFCLAICLRVVGGG